MKPKPRPYNNSRQRRIDKESTGFRVLGLFQHLYYMRDDERPLELTINEISINLACSKDLVLDATGWLLTKRYLSWNQRHCTFFRTSDGETAYSQALEAVEIASIPNFKFEALTRCTEGGKESDLGESTLAALPGTETHSRCNDSENKMIREIQSLNHIRHAAVVLGIAFDEAAHAIKFGLVDTCNGCKQLALFSRHHGGRNTRQHLCRKCRAAAARDRRAAARKKRRKK
jgi:hypothetical protein